MNREQMNAAMEALEEWLEQPERLGRLPVKIKHVGGFDLHDLHYYIFKYKKGMLGKWLLGVCGGYKGNELEHNGYVYSEMQGYEEEYAEDDAIKMIETLRSQKEQPKELEEIVRKPDELEEMASIQELDEATKSLGSAFVNSILLEENTWDKEEFVKILAEEWQIQDDGDAVGEGDKVVILCDGYMISVALVPSPVPEEEAERSAQSNYMWKEAAEVTRKHKAYLSVVIMGKGKSAIEAGGLLVKAAAACCRQKNVLGVYANGTVYQPEFYLDFAEMLKEELFPIFNLVWFGLYEGERGVCAYTEGLRSFGHDEIEVLDSSAQPLNLREFLADITLYVIQEGIVLTDGETLGFSSGEQLPITKSKGIAVEGDSIKIEFQTAVQEDADYMPEEEEPVAEETESAVQEEALDTAEAVQTDTVEQKGAPAREEEPEAAPAQEEKKPEILEQDLSEKEAPGSVFLIHLLMKEKCGMPDKESMTAVMKKHLGEVSCFSHGSDVAGFTVDKYQVEFKEGIVPPQLLIMGCTESKNNTIDELTRSQMWDCQEERDRIFAECRYQVIATDMLAAGMEYRDRADMLMDYVEALVELYPGCEAVYFRNSGKMFEADKIRKHQIPRQNRFVYFAVNVRLFNVQGKEDKVVDTLGMSTLCLPDLQYHFHGMDPNWVVNHAYNMLSYIYENNNPINSGETIDGITDGEMNREVQWKCHHEEALIQPARGVIDVCMNEYASGSREYEEQ